MKAPRRLSYAVVLCLLAGVVTPMVSAKKAFAGGREDAVLDVIRKLHEDELAAQATRVNGLHDSYLSATGTEDRKLVSLALGANYLETSPRLALQYLTSAQLACRAGDPMLPVVQYYLAEAKFRGGANREAAELAEGLLATDMSDTWRKQVNSLLIESLYAARDYTRLTQAFVEFSRRFSFSRRQESMAKMAVEAFERQNNQTESLKLLEELARGYPTTQESRWAFGRLQDAAEKPPSSPAHYMFSERLLLRLSQNVILGTGLDEFIIGAVDQPLNDDNNHAHVLGPLEKAEFFYKAHLYKPALKVVAGQLAQDPARLGASALAGLQFELGRIYIKLSEPLLATRTFSQFLYDYPHQPQVPRALEHLADSLRYLGEHLAAAESYTEALAAHDAPLLRWQHFWALYRGKDYQGALALLERPGYVQTREGDEQITLTYWHARLLERLGHPQDALRQYSEILALHADSFYALLAAIRHPELTKTRHSPEVAQQDQPAAKRLASGLALAAKATEPTGGGLPPVPELKVVDDLLRVGLNEMAGWQLSGLKWANLGQAETFAGVSRLAMVLGDYRPTRNIRTASFSSLHTLPSDWLELVQHQSAHADEWKVYYPLAFERIVGRVSSSIRLNPFLVLSVMRAESYYNKEARSSVGAQGLMQLMPYTALKIATLLHDESFDVRDLSRPELNIAYGAYYLDKLLRYYDDNAFLAVAAYNGGPIMVNQWLDGCKDCTADEFVDSIPYRETRRYVREVMRNYAQYTRIYTGKEVLAALPEMPSELPEGEEIF